MFYDIFLLLCEQRGVSPYKVSKETGINHSTIAMWKKQGATPRKDALQKIATYFGVTIDYLLSGAEKTAAQSNISGNAAATIELNDFSYALYNESKDLPPEKQAALLEMARLLNADIKKGNNGIT